jgi:P-type conjugative transfer ATPase TrbB
MTIRDKGHSKVLTSGDGVHGRVSRDRLERKLRDALGNVICNALDNASVVEVMVNPDGRLFVEHLGQEVMMQDALDPGAAEIIIGSVAHALQTEADAARPIISGVLPIGGHRFEGLLPPVVTAPSFAIRRRASRLVPLDHYVGAGIMTALQALAIREAISARMNIVICGGTGSGKTTLANAVIAEIVSASPQDRMVILEDTAEIRCVAENAVALHTCETVDMARLLKSTMRLRPDRIIVGEVRDGAALTLLKAWNTGHPGGLTTIHSNSALSALRRLEQLTAEASQQPMHAVIAEAVNLVVSIERAGKSRRVREVMRVTGFDGARYQTIHCAQLEEDIHAA